MESLGVNLLGLVFFPQHYFLEIHPSCFVYQYYAPFHGMGITLVLFFSGAIYFSLLPE